MRLGQTWLKIRKFTQWNLKNFSKIFLSVIFRKMEWLSRFNQSSISVPPENVRKTFLDIFKGCRSGTLAWSRSSHFNSMFLFSTPLKQRFSGICRGYRKGILTLLWRRTLSYRNQTDWSGFYMITASVMKELSWNGLERTLNSQWSH